MQHVCTTTHVRNSYQPLGAWFINISFAHISVAHISFALSILCPQVFMKLCVVVKCVGLVGNM